MKYSETLERIVSQVANSLRQHSTPAYDSDDAVQDAVIAFVSADPPVACETADDVSRWIYVVARRALSKARRRSERCVALSFDIAAEDPPVTYAEEYNALDDRQKLAIQRIANNTAGSYPEYRSDLRIVQSLQEIHAA